MRTRLTRKGQGLVAGLIVAAIACTSWGVQHNEEAKRQANIEKVVSQIDWQCPEGWEFQKSTFTCELSWTN